MNQSFASIRANFASLSRDADELVKCFYANLFASHPRLRAMFPADMTRQREHLAAALAMLVRNIDSFEALRPSLMELGARHVAFGVAPEYYPAMRDALIKAIEACSRPAISEELREAWLLLINQVCSIMLQGAATAALAQAQAMHPFRVGERRAGVARPV